MRTHICLALVVGAVIVGCCCTYRLTSRADQSTVEASAHMDEPSAIAGDDSDAREPEPCSASPTIDERLDAKLAEIEAAGERETQAIKQLAEKHR